MSRVDSHTMKRYVKVGREKLAELPEPEHDGLIEHIRQWFPPPGASHDDDLDGSVESETPPTLPEYPLDLPGPLGELVEARGTLPAAFVGGAGLGALAAMCPGAELVVNDDWSERPIVWPVIIGESSSGKSPALDLAFRHVHEFEALLHARYLNSVEKWNLNGRDDPKPQFTPLTAEDITEERLFRLLDRSGGHMAIVADELKTPLHTMGGAYSDSGQSKGGSGRLVRLWTGYKASYSRVGGDIDIFIRRPVVTITGNLTFFDLKILGPVKDGFRPRWLPHIAEKYKGNKLVDPETPVAWVEAMERLQGRLDDPRCWKLSEKANRIWRDQRHEWKTSSEGSEEEVTRLALGKAEKHALRIALILAESCYRRQPTTMEIPTSIMRAAIQIVDFTLDCWRVLPADELFAVSYSQRKLQDAAIRLQEWLENHKDKSASRSEIQRGNRWITSKDDRDKILLEYQKMYPGTCRVEKRNGRKTAMVYAPSQV